MSSLGKNINIYLMDGEPSGRWQANLSNWNGAAYKIPRGMLKDCLADLSEIAAPGVYFLSGRVRTDFRRFVYIGEGDDVLRRLMQPHSFERDGSYWTEAVIFVTPDGTLDKGRIKYLENRFYSLAKDAGRYILKNAAIPTQPRMTRQIKDLLEGFMINARTIAPALGLFAFEPIASVPSVNQTEETDTLLYFSRKNGKGGRAAGKAASDGFWVLKGSYIVPGVADYVPIGIKRLRGQYAAFIGTDGILTDDLVFDSPSAASTFVCGKNSNGLLEWKNKDGISLKEILYPQSEAARPAARRGKMKTARTKEGRSSEIFYLHSNQAKASGYPVKDGFTVCASSQYRKTETANCPKSVRKARERLEDEGKVRDGIFTRDVTFRSSSRAASCILGYSANGSLLWRDEKGRTIKEFLLSKED